MTGIRPFTVDDIPAVVALRRRAFRFSGWRADEQLATYFRTIFFNNPWAREDLPAIVYDSGKEIIGFLGVLPRPFKFGERVLQGAITTQFMVAPEHRGLTGTLMVRHVLKGPQDLTLADVANEQAQRIWNGAGGSVARIYCLFWSRVLRPARSAAATSLGQSLPARVTRIAARPLLNAIDSVVTHLGRSASGALGSTEETTLEEVIGYTSEIAGPATLHPMYDRDGIKWLQQRIQEKWPDSRLHVGLVRDSDARVAGTFIYLLQRNRFAQVLQLLARDFESARVLVPQILQHAFDAGAIRISGRIEQRCLDQLVASGCRLDYGSRGVMIHSKETALLHNVLSGEALLSGLEGEWWMMF
jgi:hypothetical protein